METQIVSQEGWKFKADWPPKAPTAPARPKENSRLYDDDETALPTYQAPCAPLNTLTGVHIYNSFLTEGQAWQTTAHESTKPAHHFL